MCFPNGVIFVNNDGDALRILNDAGRIEHLPKREGFFNVTHTVFDYFNHRCLASYHYGHTDGTANGYTIVALPEDSWTWKEAAAFFYNLASEDCTAAGGDPLTNFHVGFKPLPKKGNQ